MAVNLAIIRQLVEGGDATNDTMPCISSPEDLPMDCRIEFEERAAILEYDGGLSREQADRQALQEIGKRLRKMKKSDNAT